VKRAGGLWPRITSFEHLLLAADRAANGKRRRPDVGAFAFDLEPQLLRLQAELLDGTWRPGPHRSFVIREPKVRRICAAPFPDRVVHHALCGALEPVLERSFIHDSYACRRGKGTHRAIWRAREYLRRYPYYLKFDIRRYFPSVDHGVLHRLLARRFREPEVLSLCSTIIANPEPGLPPGKGLPIGNLTSQFFANVYLDKVDHFAREECRVPGYVRYMDDIVLFGPDKNGLWEHLECIRNVLEQQLLLTIKPGSVVLATRLQGLPFLGFRVFPGTIRVLRPNWRRFQRNLLVRLDAFRTGSLSQTELENSVRSIYGYLDIGNTRNLRIAAGTAAWMEGSS